MTAYLLTAAGVIFFTVIISLLLPEGKLNKTITFVLRMACILVLVQPVSGVFELSSSETYEDFFDYEYICTVYSSHQSSRLAELIYDKLGIECECEVSVLYENGDFLVGEVAVAVTEENIGQIEELESYLNELGYINISVYAKGT